MLSHLPVANSQFPSSHGAQYQCLSPQILLQGSPVLLEGDRHMCLLSTPQVHPQLPLPTSDSVVKTHGKSWPCVGDSINCQGSAWITQGHSWLLIGRLTLPPNPLPQNGYQHSL